MRKGVTGEDESSMKAAGAHRQHFLRITHYVLRISLLLLLEQEARRPDLHAVAVAEAGAGDGLVVDQRLSAQRKVFQLEPAADQVDGGVAAADALVLEQVGLAVRGGADVRGVAVEDELLARDKPLDDADPAGLGGILDQ